jgi:hypothetical protein
VVCTKTGSNRSQDHKRLSKTALNWLSLVWSSFCRFPNLEDQSWSRLGIKRPDRIGFPNTNWAIGMFFFFHLILTDVFMFIFRVYCLIMLLQLPTTIPCPSLARTWVGGAFHLFRRPLPPPSLEMQDRGVSSSPPHPLSLFLIKTRDRGVFASIQVPTTCGSNENDPNGSYPLIWVISIFILIPFCY